MEINNEEQVVLQCNECEYFCRLNIQLKKHRELKHAVETRTECNHCGFSGNGKDMKDHISKNHVSLASCWECSKTFNDEATCKVHMLADHVQSLEKDPLQCDECNKNS